MRIFPAIVQYYIYSLLPLFLYLILKILKNFLSFSPERLNRRFGAGPILDRKRGMLGLHGEIIEYSINDTAGVGTRAGIPYDRIEHFGGTIDRQSNSGTVRLRTKRNGSPPPQKVI